MITIKQQLEEALKQSLKNEDQTVRLTIRMALSSIKMVEKEKGIPIDDAGSTAILQKEIKSRREALQEAEKAHRQDLANAARLEIKILEEFLPSQLSDQEIQKIVKQAITEISATSPIDMGKIMKIVMPRIQGRAAGDRVSAIVKELLQ